MTTGAEANFKKAQAKRERVLELVKQGMRIHPDISDPAAPCVLHEIGWVRQSYEKNRKKYPLWAAEIDKIRAELGTRKKELRSIARKVGDAGMNHLEFVEFYFGMKHMPHQVQLADELDHVQPGEVVMVLLWPEAGKSTTVENYICRKLAVDPAHRFQIISETGKLAERMLSRVKNRLTDEDSYRQFISDYGPFKNDGQEREGRVWAADRIKIAKASLDDRDYSIWCRAWSSQAYGSRVDTLIIDDIQSRKNMNQASEIVGTLRQTFFTRSRDIRVVIVGTRIADGDVYEKMLELGLVHRLVMLPASGGMGTATGEPSVPEFWDQQRVHDGKACCFPKHRKCPRDYSPVTPREEMESRRFMVGESIWQSSYQQNPLAGGLTTFSAALDGCLDRDRVVQPLVPA